jgi:hypothetical protein
MASSLSARARAALVLGTTALLVPGVAGPASAMSGIGGSGTFDDGEERGTPMGLGQAVLVFVILPVAIAGLIWLIVKAPGWTRSGRTDADAAWTEEPLSVGAAASADRPGLVASGQAPDAPELAEASVEPADADGGLTTDADSGTASGEPEGRGTGGTSAAF